jgi:hypothetical protein
LSPWARIFRASFYLLHSGGGCLKSQAEIRLHATREQRMDDMLG